MPQRSEGRVGVCVRCLLFFLALYLKKPDNLPLSGRTSPEESMFLLERQTSSRTRLTSGVMACMGGIIARRSG